MVHNRTRVILIIIEIAVTLAIVTNCVNMIVDERRKILQLVVGGDRDESLGRRGHPPIVVAG